MQIVSRLACRTIVLFTLAFLALFATMARAAGVEEEVRAAFERFVEVQNRHDAGALAGILADTPQFLWITRGNVVWGHEAALKRFRTLYEGTWRLDPEMAQLRIVPLSEEVAQIHIPIVFTTGAPGQPSQASRVFINQVLVKREGRWRVVSIFPIPAPTP